MTPRRLQLADWLVADLARLEREHGRAELLVGRARDRVVGELERAGVDPTYTAIANLGARKVALLRSNRQPTEIYEL